MGTVLKKIEQAKRYWNGETKGELVETLLGGIIKVEKIVEDAQKCD